jgi:flagellar M-ring protein FliF
MDFLNKGFAQLADLFRGMTPGARLLAGLLLAVVVVSVGYLFNHGYSRGDGYLMGGRPIAPDELPAMEAAFDKAGLTSYEIEGNRIRVPLGQQSAYMGALADEGALPLDYHAILEKELSGADGIWLDKATREARIKNARQRELALIIRSMSGIANAAVHYDTRKLGGLPAREITTASVSVKPQPGQTLDGRRVKAIRDLVARSIAGMQPTDVAVVDLATGQSYAASDGVPAGSDSVYLQTQQAFQASVREELLGALSYVPGVVVTVNVELSKELAHRTETVKLDPKNTTAIMSQEETRTSSQETAPPRGRPGIESNGPGPNGGGTLAGSAAGDGNRTEDESSSSQQRSLVGHTTESMEQAPLTPERITVAVAVPDNYFVNIWRQKNPTPAGQDPPVPPDAELRQIEQDETTKIRAHAAQVIPKPANTIDPTPLVTVTTFHAVPPEAPAEESLAQAGLAWAGQYWSTLGMIGLGLLSLVMLRSMVRSVPAPTPAPLGPAVRSEAAAPAAIGGPEPPEAPATPAAPRPKRKFAGAPSPKDELAALVQDDPDAAANILRSWIGNPT